MIFEYKFGKNLHGAVTNYKHRPVNRMELWKDFKSGDYSEKYANLLATHYVKTTHKIRFPLFLSAELKPPAIRCFIANTI